MQFKVWFFPSQKFINNKSCKHVKEVTCFARKYRSKISIERNDKAGITILQRLTRMGVHVNMLFESVETSVHVIQGQHVLNLF